MSLVWIVDITAHTSGSPDTVTLRFASYPGYNHPDATGYYPPRIKQPALIRRHIVASGRIIGDSEVSYGELVINNKDGAYDDILEYGYGDAAELRLGDSTRPPSEFTTVLTGIVEQPTGDDNEIVFRFRDRQIELDQLVSPNVYLGDNLESPSGSGVEGTADDIKGQNKIRCFGQNFNVDVDPVNTGENIFALNHDNDGDSAAVASVDAVRVNGAPWDFGADHGSLGAILAATPAQGDYDTALSLGLIKLGGTIGQGRVTVDYTET